MSGELLPGGTVFRSPGRRWMQRRSPAALVLALLTLALAAGFGDALPAQQLLTVGEVEARPVPPVGTGGLAVSAAAAVSEPVTVDAAAVQVNLDLVRSASPRLDLPTLDGRVRTAELTVFKDRGDGDAMWSGRLLGAGHDSVVLTIAGGRLAGWFGEPQGAKYRVGAEASGAGLMVDAYPGLVRDDWCGHEEYAPNGRAVSSVPADRQREALVGRTRDFSSHRDHDGLRMLVLYTESAARVWDNPQYGWGGTEAALRNATDYLTMVFRNGRLPLEPEFEFAKAPAWLDAVQGDPLTGIDGIVGAFDTSGEVQLLRRNAGADHVHLFYLDDVLPLRFVGLKTLLGGASLLGAPIIFTHEVGHDLGGSHQPEVRADSIVYRRSLVEEHGFPEWYLHAFAHAWHRDGRGVEDGEWGDFGSGVAYPSTEPYYSTIRLEPQGQQIGIAGERENERAFGTTMYELAARSLREETVPAPVTNLAVEVGSGSVRLTWTDNSTNETGFSVQAIPHRDWNNQLRYDVGVDTESLELSIAEPGVYTAIVSSLPAFGPGGAISTFNYREDETFVIPGAEPRVPTDVDATVDPDGWAGADRCRVVTWNERFTAADNDFAGVFEPRSEVQILRDGALFKRLYVDAGKESLSYCLPPDSGLYEFRVYARSWGGRSNPSEPVTVAVGIEEPIAVRAGDRAVALHWGGDWAKAARGSLRVEARSPAMDGWTELANANAADGSARIDGLAPETPYTFRLAAVSGGVAEYSELFSLTTGPPVESCRSGPAYLCLLDGRFEVRAHWSNPDRSGDFGKGTAVPVASSDESGLFWFFDPENVELVLKVLDGRALNGNHWVFFGALSDVEYWVTVEDTEPGRRLTYYNPPKRICGQSDTQSFGVASAAGFSYSTALTEEDSAELNRLSRTHVAEPSAAEPGVNFAPFTEVDAVPLDWLDRPASSESSERPGSNGICVPGDSRLCLLGDRFSVEVEFIDPNDGMTKAGRVTPSLTTASTGFFWFFSSGNIELAAKVLDGRALNGKFWFLYGGLSDVEFAIRVTDTATGESRTYRNPRGSVCGGIDTSALGQ